MNELDFRRVDWLKFSTMTQVASATPFDVLATPFPRTVHRDSADTAKFLRADRPTKHRARTRVGQCYGVTGQLRGNPLARQASTNHLQIFLFVERSFPPRVLFYPRQRASLAWLAVCRSQREAEDARSEHAAEQTARGNQGEQLRCSFYPLLYELQM